MLSNKLEKRDYRTTKQTKHAIVRLINMWFKIFWVPESLISFFLVPEINLVHGGISRRFGVCDPANPNATRKVRRTLI
jgi:hypothetical protein